MNEEPFDEDRDISTQQVQAQFGQAAKQYVTSAVHARGSDLQRMLELAQLRGTEHVLDVATGGGHTAGVFAVHVPHVVAYDITFKMLCAARSLVAQQQIVNMNFCSGSAAYLPFPDHSFHCVTTRIAAHHFAEPERFVYEVARVLHPEGMLLLNDNMVPDDPALDMCMNRFEEWRDPSHVRAYTSNEWRMWLEHAGLRVTHVEPLARKQHDFGEWTTRMHMSDAERDQLEDWLLTVPQHCAKFFDIVVENNRVQSLSNTYSIIVAQSMK